MRSNGSVAVDGIGQVSVALLGMLTPRIWKCAKPMTLYLGWGVPIWAGSASAGDVPTIGKSLAFPIRRSSSRHATSFPPLPSRVQTQVAYG